MITEFYVWLVIAIVYFSLVIIGAGVLIVRTIKKHGRATGMIGVEQKLASRS